jgi:hypothetical protein
MRQQGRFIGLGNIAGISRRSSNLDIERAQK